MKTHKNGFDEMQLERRNKIGNQLFMLMFYALLFDAGLYGAGIRWLEYPSNVMVIIMVFMTIYLIRTIAANAYLPPKTQGRKSLVYLIVTIVLSVILAIAFVFLFGKASNPISLEEINDNSAWILFVVSASGLLISGLVAIIKRVNDRKSSDD